MTPRPSAPGMVSLGGFFCLLKLLIKRFDGLYSGSEDVRAPPKT